MAFYIESRFVDIRTLVDFTDFDESAFNTPQILKTPNNTSNPSIQNQENLDNSAALEQVTQIIVQNETKTDLTPTIDTENILGTNNSTHVELPAPIIEVVDKTSLYINFISQKYDKNAADEFIRILLNPFIVILAYRYEFLNSADNNTFSFNLRHLSSIQNKKLTEIDNDSETPKDENIQNDFQIYKRKKDLEKKLNRKPN